MPSADVDKAYPCPSRGSRALIVILSLGVVLLAGWIVTANLTSLFGVSAPAANPPAAQVAEAQAPADEATDVVDAAPADATAAAPAESAEEPVRAFIEPPQEPFVVAAVGEPPPTPSPTVAAVIDPETTQGLGEATFAPGEIVPLPPQRRRASAIPVPRPRPDIEVEPEPVGRMLSDAEIDRMN